MRTVAILASHRGQQGNTHKILNRLIENTSCELIDLSLVKLNHFNYEQEYEDDFLPIVQKILQSELVLLATPIHWYSYSSLMKVFIDRFSDLLTSQKELGRRLRGKRFVLVGSGSQILRDETLNTAFAKFCTYLGIKNAGFLYANYDGEFSDSLLASGVRNLITN